MHSNTGYHVESAKGEGGNSATRVRSREKTLGTEVPVDGLVKEVKISLTLKRREGFKGEGMMKGILGKKCEEMPWEAGMHTACLQRRDRTGVF